MELSSTEGNCFSFDSAKTSCFTRLNTSLMLRPGSLISFNRFEVNNPFLPLPSEATLPASVANTIMEPLGAFTFVQPCSESRLKLGIVRQASRSKMFKDLLDAFNTDITAFIFKHWSSKSLDNSNLAVVGIR